jgi:hypothetical protein
VEAIAQEARKYPKYQALKQSTAKRLAVASVADAMSYCMDQFEFYERHK